ncbi:flagellar operon protein (TIGR03826 family) [Salirhabdus euzebyi]|uniref:Flagellar operon protein (TIGR03826 family) n=1 Tax=Salirhabdus euzebyi TaxID=394506 RepID=A0A841Q5N1_9BACI|nr:TIGR03826 family flagellar region protein [Salirhabdus euzebyi]MBB6453632.1 flagellar operon protein (TIGR03826 family) [Salirhabdus euzebyi]
MGELANCPTCGALFVKGVQSVCQKCYKEEEKAFETVHGYIRKKENRTATVPEVSETTGVEERLIMKFVKERRLHTTHFPNLTYGCERCGEPIGEGKICNNCKDELRADLSLEEKIETIREKQDRESKITYFSVNRKDKR